MNEKQRNVGLVIVLFLIVIAIGYLEAKKAKHIVATKASEIVVAPPQQVANTGSSSVAPNRSALITQKSSRYPRAKELTDPSGFINTPPFKLADIAGHKVVLLDFWTYSCINCQRTIPYLNAWYQKYKDHGLEIVGVHTPEFDFEKDYNNVSMAVKKLGIQYPVVLDNDMGTWDVYDNQFWPHEYLIDIDGFIVHDKIGEGDYAGTEQAIQAALKERDEELGITDTIPAGIVNPADVISMDTAQVGSPETYFGSNRNEYLANGVPLNTGIQTLTVPAQLKENGLYLDGTWNFNPEFAENQGNAKVVFQYKAKNVYIVGSSASHQAVIVKVLIDGKPIDPSMMGADVAPDGTMKIDTDRLYSIVKGVDYQGHTLELDIQGPDLDAYTFTFG